MLKLFLLFGLLFQGSLGYDFDALVQDTENYDPTDVSQVVDLLHKHDVLNKDDLDFDFYDLEIPDDLDEQLSAMDQTSVTPEILSYRTTLLILRSRLLSTSNQIAASLLSIANRLSTAPPPRPAPAPAPAPATPGLRFSYFRIVNGYSYLTLCAVQLYGQLNGVGPIRRILLSTSPVLTTQINTGWGGVAGRAVNNKDDPIYNNGQCSHTQTTVGAWWQTRFSGSWLLRTVRILNRKDCCAERLRTLIFYGSTNGRTFTKIGFYPGPAAAGAWVNIPLSIIKPPPPVQIPPAGLVSYFRIVNEYSYLTLCGVRLYGQLNGVGSSVEIKIPQSSATQINTGWGGVPGRAIDGVFDPNYGGGHCSHTQTEAGSWWQVKLPGSYRLRFVRILNRKDCCADRFRSIKYYGSSDGKGFLWIGSYRGPAGPGAWVTSGLLTPRVEPAKRYRYLRIVNTYSYLTLCGVELYGQLNGVGDVRRIPTNPAWTRQINTGWGGISGRAVDGTNDPNYGGGHCSHTQTAANSWWQTYLPGFWSITQIKILNRKDCCAERLRGLKFYGSMSSVSGFEQIGSYAGPGAAGAWITINIPKPSQPPPPPQGYYSFRIVNGFSYLTLCGVELYGRRSTGGPEIKIPLIYTYATQINTGWSGLPSKAINGINNGYYWSDSCSHTQTQAGAWWQVRLPPTSGGWILTRVKVWNRVDCCWDRLRKLTFFGGSSTSGGTLKKIGAYEGPAGRGAIVTVNLDSRGMIEALEGLHEDDFDFTNLDYDFAQHASVEEYEYEDEDDQQQQSDILDVDEYEQYQNAVLVMAKSNENQLFQLFRQYPLSSIFALFISFALIYYFVNNRKQGKTLLSTSSSEYTPLKAGI